MKKSVVVFFCALFLLSGCASNKFDKWNVSDVQNAIIDAGLELDNPKIMSIDDYQLIPAVAKEGIYFKLPSVCEDCGGHIYSFENAKDLKSIRTYYRLIGIFRTPAYFFRRGNIVITISGRMQKEKAKKYRNVLISLPVRTGIQRFKIFPASKPTVTNKIEPTIKPTVTPIPTVTPKPTQTPQPVSGSFQNPVPLGNTLIVQPIPPGITVNNQNLGEMACSVIEVIRGDEALSIAKREDSYSAYTPLLDGQEFLAVHIKLQLLEVFDANNSQVIYQYWHLTLRDEEGGSDVWSENPMKIIAKGYVPLEGEGWIIFRIREGSKPYLYFSPWLMITEQEGIRNTGAYFRLFDPELSSDNDQS